MSIPNSKLSTSIPSFLSGTFDIFVISQTKDEYPIDYLIPLNKKCRYANLSISEKLRFEFESRKKNNVKKIRVQQIMQIDTYSVLYLEGKFYKVFNVFHSNDKNNIPISDITLVEYINPVLEV